jgi:CMP-N-acetylneuraminic acid synthetase
LRCVAFIFARGGSKGLPGKNIKLLAGKPLIAHSIETARAIPRIETVIVSTDDESIARVARAFGAETPFLRPSELATDRAPEWLAWQHAIRWFEQHRGPFDVFVSLPATAPFRTSDDVERCLNCLLENEETDIIVTGCEASRSPYFNMVQAEQDGTVRLAIEGHAYANRQEAPKLFDMTTLAYVARPSFVISSTRVFDGKVRLVEVPPERALDIDTPLDFEMAEFLASRKKHQK